jgi:spermidine synthase
MMLAKNDSTAGLSRWPLILYVCTGFTGLLIEQGFEKYLLLLVGATVSASSVVIFAYFLGFALGGLGIAQLQKNAWISKPLAWYGVLEFSVGAAAILFTYIFHPLVERLAPLQGGLTDPLARSMVRFLFGCLFVLPTAALMGASFPLMAQVVDRKSRSGGGLWATVYAGNLVGAVIAALLGPYLIYPAIGVRGAFWLSFGICAAVFCAALYLERVGAYEHFPPQPVTVGDAKGQRSVGRDGWLLLAAAFATGLIVFALEVLWTHLISVILGCSVYAFSAMLLMVLLGLFLGAFRTAADLKRGKAADYHGRFLNCALLIAIQMIGWSIASLFFAFVPPRPFQNFTSTEIWKLAVAAALILPSATALGTLFPSLLGSSVLRKGERCFLVGYLNAANAIGCQCGTLLGLFVLIPIAGSELSLKLIAAALVAFSFLFLPRGSKGTSLARSMVAALIILVPCVFWHWDPFLLTSYLSVTFGASQRGGTVSGAAVTSGPKMIYFREGAQGGITTVTETKSGDGPALKRVRTLFTNGKFEGDDNIQRDAQFGVAALATVFVKDMDRALLIGLGTGHSALALTQLGYRDIDVAEFSPGIIEAARTYFGHLNHGILSDPRVHLMQEDGRNVLISRNSPPYDLITIEITSIWFAGATNVYSIEFYRQARKHLRPDGVLQQWVQLHNIGPAEVASAIATARAVFPYASYWYFGDQGFIVATNRPQRVEESRAAYMLNVLPKPDPNRLLARMLASRILDPEAVDRMIAADHPRLNTDHNRFIEYATPRYYSSDYNWTAHNRAFLAAFQTRDSTLIPHFSRAPGYSKN